MHTYVGESSMTVADGKCVAAASLMPYGNLFQGASSQPECMLIVDSGFSFTHVVPILSGRIVWKAVKRYGGTASYACFPTRGKIQT
jgi:actin-related protein